MINWNTNELATKVALFRDNSIGVNQMGVYLNVTSD